ncbi:MAG: ferredoxin-type protein NapG, partial [Actinobacillus porcinus]|nr:ferredoxin-type protein NapG [Actinobacillus porcinus]
VYQPMQVQPNLKVATPSRATQDYVPKSTTVPDAEHFPNLDLNIKGVK